VIKIVLVMLFIWNGELKLHRETFKTEDACMAAGRALMEQQMKDPRFDQGLFAGCVPMKVQETSK